MTLTLIIAWYFLATVDYEMVWMWGPYETRVECEAELEQIVPLDVETTGCKVLSLSLEEHG